MNNIISIVTPSFNQGEFIEKTIQSVLSQEGNFYIDYIIADGGSTDNTVEIIKKYDKLLQNDEYPIKCQGIEFKWWSQPDKGQSNAINKGFKETKGDILAWINSDDHYEPLAFQAIFQIFSTDPLLDMVYGKARAIYKENKEIRIIEPGQESLERSLYRGHTIPQSSVFFSRKIFFQAQGLDENLYLSMDYDLWFKMIKKRAKTYYTPSILSNFVLWEGCKSVANSQEAIIANKEIRKKYGGNIVSPATVYNKISKIPLFKSFKANFPGLYLKLKKVAYFFVDKLKHNNDSQK
jgi:glycosyltransferase involved in cell wall biosynthesis